MFKFGGTDRNLDIVTMGANPASKVSLPQTSHHIRSTTITGKLLLHTIGDSSSDLIPEHTMQVYLVQSLKTPAGHSDTLFVRKPP